jgi:GAF domain-containing protein
LGRLARLQPLTAALSQAVTSSQVTHVILTEAFAALQASAGIASALTDDGTEFVCLGVLGYPEEVATGWRRLPADHPVPIAVAVRDRSPVFITTRQECAALYPLLSRVRGTGADGALAALPLLVRGRPIGALGLSFPTDRDFSEQDRQFMLTLAGLCANALERARLYDVERAARERAEQEVEQRRRAEEERESLIRELRDALATVRTLRGLLPICAWCKNIRNDQGYWKRLEAYLTEHLDVKVTHGLCPPCAEKMQAELGGVMPGQP